MTCPKCALINPPQSERCDCGYDFISGTVKKSYLETKREHKQGRLRRIWWPDIYDLESSRKVAKAGAWAAFALAGLNGIVAALAMLGVSAVKGKEWGLIDALLMVGFGFGMWKMSRVCSICALILYALGQMNSFTAVDAPRNIGMLALFAMYFANAVRATYAYHEYSQDKIEVASAQS